MARGRKVKKGDTRSFGDFKKAQNEKRLDRIISQGKKSYASQNRGQSGGSSSISSQAKKATIDNLQRQKFFKGRDVPEERLRKRIKQDTLERLFKDRFTKPVNVVDPVTGEVTGVVSGLTQATADAPRSLTEERQRLANIYGPTLSEVAGDIGYGLGQLVDAYGIPFVSTAQRIGGGLKDLYDYFFTKPTVTTGGSSDITVTEGPTFVPPTFDNRKIEVQQLPALLPPSQQGDATFRNDYPFLYDSRLDNLPFKAVPNNINDQINFQKALANARVENTGLGLNSLKAAYDFARNPTLNTQYGDFSLDNVFTGNPQMNYGNTVMINGVPVDLSASIGQGGISGGLSFAFNKGGSVNKHSGLGYMLK